MDPIRPIGPPELDVDPIRRVERASEEERREQEERRRREREKRRREELLHGAEIPQATPEQGDDGGTHIDVRV